MLDYQDYTIQTDHYQGNGNGNGYSHLEGDWLLFHSGSSIWMQAQLASEIGA
jgi:hypothetical protein